jgi:sirohydrochlorin cobaltochelatase
MAGAATMKRPTCQSEMEAVVLFAHGSRDLQWQKPLRAVEARVRVLAPTLPLRCAFLEWTEPDLPSAVAELISEGATAVRILPLFLGMGRHAREDLPQAVEALRVRWPQVAFTLRPAIGEDPRLVDLLAHFTIEATAPPV